MTQNPPFTFKKIDTKWQAEINGKFAFEMFSVYGIPLEMTQEEINNWKPEEREQAMLNSWKIFAQENKIDLNEIRESNLAYYE